MILNIPRLGLHFIESEKSGFAVNISTWSYLESFYSVALERKADGVDYKKESYDKVIDSAQGWGPYGQWATLLALFLQSDIKPQS